MPPTATHIWRAPIVPAWILELVTFDRTIGRTLKPWRVSGNLGEIALLTNKDVTNCVKVSRLIQGTGEDTHTRLVR